MSGLDTLKRCDAQSDVPRVIIAVALLGILILASYVNTFRAAWQFDDKPNILHNTILHIKNLNPVSLVQTSYTQPTHPGQMGTKLYRPISFLTFAVNWYVGQDKVLGYHVVNLLIHFLTSVFLFLTILILLKTPNTQYASGRGRILIAFLAAALWAINPIQTQAVTYIVQRMASMAAMFYILSILCYIRCRMSTSSAHRIGFMLGCAMSFLLALGSKENAAMLPAALVLIELTCFQDFDWRSKKGLFWGAAIAASVMALVLAIWTLNAEAMLSFLNGYQHRPFTLYERLLTEPRIILFYLSQIFFPLPSRLSVEHDVILSTSLMQPWTTGPAILLTMVLIGLGMSQIRKRPFIALALLFFFLNHIIESTVIPLELIFEHRNYLPSMFLFVPVAMGFKWLYDQGLPGKRHLQAVLTGLVVFLILGLVSGTYTRNRVWATEISLWRDAMKKAPQSARPLTNLAWQMAYGPNASKSQYEAALMLYEQALVLQKPRSLSESVIMNNMAGIYFRQEQYQRAINLLQNALTIAPDYDRGRYHLAKILMVSGQWADAAAQVEHLLSKNEVDARYMSLKGLVLLHQKKYEPAIRNFRQALNFSPFFKESLMNLGIAYSLIGNYDSAEVYLLRAHRVHPKNMAPLLGLIENGVRASDLKSLQKYAGLLISSYPDAAIKNQLIALAKDHRSLFLSAAAISPVIESQRSDNLKNIAEFSD